MVSMEIINKINEMREAFENSTGYKLNKERLEGYAKEMYAIVECAGSLEPKTLKNMVLTSYKNMYKTLLEDTLKNSLAANTENSDFMADEFEELMTNTFDLVAEAKTVIVESNQTPSKTSKEISDISSKLLENGFTEKVKKTLSTLNNKDLQKLCNKHENVVRQILDAREKGIVGPSWGEEKLQMYEETLVEMKSMLSARPSNEKTVKEVYDLTAPYHGGLFVNEIHSIEENVKNHADELTTKKLSGSVSALSSLVNDEIAKNSRDITYFKNLDNVEKVGAIYNELNNRFSNRSFFSKFFHLDEYFTKNSILNNMMTACNLSKQSVLNLFEKAKDTTYTSKIDDALAATEAMSQNLKEENSRMGVLDLDKQTSIESNEINPDFISNEDYNLTKENIL